jgi:hypothetical protein
VTRVTRFSVEVTLCNSPSTIKCLAYVGPR